MEIYRELGLYEAMRQESAKAYDEHAGIVDVESLAGRHIGTWMANMNEGIEKVSPAGRMFLTQNMFEPILKAHAIEHGADLHFSTELISFEQDSEGVTSLVRNTESGERKLVRSEYLVACDGNRSPVRERLGIQIKGHGLLSHALTIYFKADIEHLIKGRYNGVIYVNNPDVRGFFRVDKTGHNGFLVVNTAGKQGTEESRFPADTITDAKARQMLRAAVGEDVNFQITLVAKWRAVCDNAAHYNTARVLLAGDAAHTVTPHGGFGGNTGIQDAHNLAWKLAAVLKGHAGRDLVEQTYSAERWPVGEKTVNQVFERYVKRTAPELRATAEDLEEEIPEPHLELGYRYHSAALMTEGLDVLTEDPNTAIARPGTRAPHVLVSTPAAINVPISDLFTGHFVLLLGAGASEWEMAAQALQSDPALPKLQTRRVQGKGFDDRYRVGPSGAVLVRPDGFIAWLCPGKPASVTAGLDDLRAVMRKILCLSADKTVQSRL